MGEEPGGENKLTSLTLKALNLKSNPEPLWDRCRNLKPQSVLLTYRPKIHIIKLKRRLFTTAPAVLYNKRGVQTATSRDTSG